MIQCWVPSVHVVTSKAPTQLRLAVLTPRYALVGLVAVSDAACLNVDRGCVCICVSGA